MTVNDGQQNVHTEVFNYNGDTGSMSSKGPDQQNLTPFVYGDIAHKHAISEFGSNDYYYNANGSQTHRLLEDGSWYIRLHYNPNNQMHYVEFITTPEASPTIMGMMLEIESPTATPTLMETPTGTPIAVQSETPAPTETAVPTETLLPTDTPSATDIPQELETPTETGIPEATATPAPQEIRVEETQPATTESPTTAAQPTEAPTEEPTALPTSTETPTPAETGTEIFVELPGMIPTMTETPAAMETTTPSDLPPEPEFTRELLNHLMQRPEEDNGEMMLMSTLAGVYEVSYYYDADGNMVESVVRAQVDNQMSIQRQLVDETVYIGNYYERQVNYVIDMNTSELLSREFIYRKYFSAGGTRIVMRLYRGGTTTLYWLLSDHLGSQSITANVDGSLNSEVRYTAFGETRYTTATETPTDYLYTGQRIEEEAGLYYYNARFYDPVLSHFTQADTLVPNVGSLLSYLRYAYVSFNPLIYMDPSGHTPNNGCSLEQDTGNCPVDWDDGGLGDDYGDYTGNGTELDKSKLTPRAKKAYEVYRQMYSDKNGWWWRKFGGHFTLANFITVGLFYAEGDLRLSDVDLAFSVTVTYSDNEFPELDLKLNLIDAMAEGGSRSYFQYLKTYNYPDSQESMLAWAMNTQQSFRNRIFAIFSGYDGGTIQGQFAYKGDIKNAITVSYKFFNPDSSWREGFNRYRPFAWGNNAKYLSQYSNDPTRTVWFFDNFYVPTGKGSG